MSAEPVTEGTGPIDSNVNGPTLTLDGLPFQWQMTRGEKFAFHALVESIKPPVAMEIGTYRGGSLQVISAHATKVYSLDISPEPRDLLQERFDNVEFHVGPSRELIPHVLQRITNLDEELQFVLVDGDHSEEGVRADIDAILKHRPTSPLTIVFHDSFHPPCRRGILQAAWEACPFVHYVEVDFIPGVFHQHAFDTAPAGSMYGGLAVAQLRPEARKSPLTIHCSQQGLFDITFAKSCYQQEPRLKSHFKRVRRRAHSMGARLCSLFN